MKAITLGILLFTTQILFAQKSDLTELKIIGHVKTISENEYQFSQHHKKKTKKVLGYSGCTLFNKSGNIVERKYSTNTLNVKDSFIYDIHENKIEEIEFNYKYSFTIKKIYKYDNNNNEIERIIYDPNKKIQYKFIHIYDRNKNLIEQIDSSNINYSYYKYTYEYDENNRIMVKKFDNINLYYIYDSIGNIIEINLIKNGNSFACIVKNKYNQLNKIIEHYENNLDSSLNKKEIYLYKNDTLIEKKEFSSDKLTKSEVFEYSEEGKTHIEKNFNSFDGLLISTSIIKYDKYGNHTEESYSDDNYQSKYFFVYEYDNEGNWIRKTIYNDKSIEKLIEREIEYY